jgi:hypothetical protein
VSVYRIHHCASNHKIIVFHPLLVQFGLSRLLHYLLTGQYLAEWRSEHAHVRAEGRTWGFSPLDMQ